MDCEWWTAMSNSFGSLNDTASVFMYDAVNANLSTFTDMFNQILSDGNARSMSSSWGCAEFDCYDNGTMDTQDGIFSSMAGQGWTMFIASDDQGVVAGCGNHAAVEFPASDPHVVASGGTTLSLDSFSNYLSEVACAGGPDGRRPHGGCTRGGWGARVAAPGSQGNRLC